MLTMKVAHGQRSGGGGEGLLQSRAGDHADDAAREHGCELSHVHGGDRAGLPLVYRIDIRLAFH